MRTSCLCSAFLTISCSNSKAVNKHLPELLFCLHCCFRNSNSVHQTQYMRLTRKARIGLCPTHICYERNSPQGFRCLLHQLGLRGPARCGSFWKAKDSGRKGRTQEFYRNEKRAVGCGLVVLNPRLTTITQRDFIKYQCWAIPPEILIYLTWAGAQALAFPKIPWVMMGLRTTAEQSLGVRQS